MSDDDVDYESDEKNDSDDELTNISNRCYEAEGNLYNLNRLQMY